MTGIAQALARLAKTPVAALRHAALRMHRDERGTAAVSFILCLPIFMTIVAIIVQFALILNAKLVISEAAAAAARSAQTSLPEEAPDNASKAARFMLVPISPKATSGADAEGTEIENALAALGVTVPDAFADRYTFALAATEIILPPGDFKRTAGQDIEVTVRYKFQLTVPFAMAVLNQSQVETVGGVTGRFYTLTSTVRIQTSHGRAANADGSGWPY